MPIATELTLKSPLMSIGIALVAVFLGLHQWYERRAREADLSDIDRRYFLRQDLRRGLGVAILLLIALGMWVGSGVESNVAGRANLPFLKTLLNIWLGIILLVIVLLVLALVDWLDTRRYAARQRQSITRERLKMLGDTYHRMARKHRDDSEDGQRAGN